MSSPSVLEPGLGTCKLLRAYKSVVHQAISKLVRAYAFAILLSNCKLVKVYEFAIQLGTGKVVRDTSLPSIWVL